MILVNNYSILYPFKDRHVAAIDYDRDLFSSNMEGLRGTWWKGQGYF